MLLKSIILKNLLTKTLTKKENILSFHIETPFLILLFNSISIKNNYRSDLVQ